MLRIEICLVSLGLIWFSGASAATKLFNDTEWSNGCGPCIGETCESGYLRKLSNIGIDPSGSSLCNDETRILSKEDWIQAIKNGELPGQGVALKTTKFVELSSFEDLARVIKSIGGNLSAEAKPAVEKFLAQKVNHPVLFYALSGQTLVVLAGTSDGKTVSFSTDEFAAKRR